MTDELNLPPAHAVMETTPAIAWVIHKVVRSDSTEAGIWAWCRVDPDGEPGYREVVCTLPDGITRAPTPERLVLGPVITRIWC